MEVDKAICVDHVHVFNFKLIFIDFFWNLAFESWFLSTQWVYWSMRWCLRGEISVPGIEVLCPCKDLVALIKLSLTKH